MDRVSIVCRMCAGREFQVEGADTEKAKEETLLVIPGGLVRRSVGRTQARIEEGSSEGNEEPDGK